MSTVNSKQFAGKTILALAIAAPGVMPVFAQDSGAGSLVLEEVVVTAQKKEETLAEAPLTGWAAASCALESPLKDATTAASTTAKSTDGPATPAAMPMLTKIPVPRIDPSPKRIAPGTPTTRARPSEVCCRPRSLTVAPPVRTPRPVGF